MNKKFYYLLLKDNKKIGVLYAPKGTDTRFGERVLPVIGYENMTFQLKGGMYAPFMNSNVNPYFANEELKQLIEQNLPADYPLEFLPVKTMSEEYGENLYYIIQFTKIFDVIDEKHSKYVPGTDSIAVPCIDYNKAKDLDFFNSTARRGSFIVSDKIKKLMKKRKLDTGIEFWEWRSL